MKEYSGKDSPCCGADEHRPGDSGPWFCMECGKARKEEKEAADR